MLVLIYLTKNISLVPFSTVNFFIFYYIINKMSGDIFRDHYGNNYEKVNATSPVEIRKMKEDFMKKYPGAKMSKFDFQVTFAKDGTVEDRDIEFKVTDLESYDIESNTFKRN